MPSKINLTREQLEELMRGGAVRYHGQIEPVIESRAFLCTHIYCPTCWALLSSRLDSRDCRCGNDQPVKHGFMGLAGEIIKWCNAQRFPIVAAAIAAAEPDTFKETWANGMKDWQPLPHGYLLLPDEVIDDINRSDVAFPQIYALGCRARLNLEMAYLRAIMGDEDPEADTPAIVQE